MLPIGRKLPIHRLNRLKFLEPDLEKQGGFEKVDNWEKHLRTC